MDDSIVNLLSGSPRRSGRTQNPANLWFPCSFEVAAQSENRRSQQHNEEAGKDKENQGKQNLDFGFSGRFFGALTPRDTNLLGITAEGADDGSTEAVGLLQHGDEGSELLELGAVGHALPGVETGLTGTLFEVDLVEFLVELGIADGDFLADAEQGLIEAEAGFDADDEQVDGVGNAFLNLFLALIDSTGKPDIGKQIADRGEGEAPEGGVGVDEGAAEDASDGADEAGGEIEVELAAALEAGGDEALAELLIFRESEAGAEGRERGKGACLWLFPCCGRCAYRADRW